MIKRELLSDLYSQEPTRQASCICRNLYLSTIAFNCQLNRLPVVIVNIVSHLSCALNLFASHCNDSIPAAKSCILRWGTRSDISDDHWQASIVGHEIESPGGFTILSAHRRLDSQCDTLTVAIDYDRKRLTGRQQRITAYYIPTRILCSVERNKSIARFQPRYLCCTTGHNVINYRSGCRRH